MDISFDAIVISLAPLFPSAIHVIQDFIKQFCDSKLLSFSLRKFLYAAVVYMVTLGIDAANH